MNTTCPAASAPTTKSRTRCTWSAEERLEWITLLEQSGQSISEFCRANDLPESTVSLWRKQLRGAPAAPNEVGALIEVPIATVATSPAPSCAASTSVIIRLPSEIELQVTAGTDLAWLAGLIRTLRSA